MVKLKVNYYKRTFYYRKERKILGFYFGVSTVKHYKAIVLQMRILLFYWRDQVLLDVIIGTVIDVLSSSVTM